MAKKNDKGFQPVGDRLLITRQKIDEKTESGIILPANHKRKMFENLATVIAVGDGEKEACEARILNFLMQIGLWGIIAISIAMIMIGALGTILIQRVYDRHKKGRPERNEWMDKGGEQI